MNEKRPDDLLSAYFDDEVSAQQRLEVERQLSRSAPSRRELDEIDRLSELLRSLPTESAPPELAASVLRRTKREVLPAREQTVHTTSRARAWTAVAATFFATAAALFALVKVFDRPTTDRVVKAEPAAISKSGDRSGGEFGRKSNTEGHESGGAQVAGIDRAKQSVREHDARIGESVLKTAPDKLAAPQAVDLKNVRPGEVIPYFEHVGDRVAWVDVTVIDVRKAIGTLQVLLLKNAIPPVSDESPDAALGDTSPQADESTDGLFAIYVVATEQQLASTLAVMGEQELFVDLQLKPPVEIDRIAVAALEPRSPEGLLGRRVKAAETDALQQKLKDRASPPLETLNLRPRQPMAPAVKPDGLADKVELKKKAKSRRKSLENAKPGRSMAANAVTKEAPAKTEKEASSPGAAGGGKVMAATPRDGNIRSFWRFVKLPTDALDFESPVTSAKDVREDKAVSPSPSPPLAAEGKRGAAGGRPPGRQSQPIRAMFVFHARSAKPAAKSR